MSTVLTTSLNPELTGATFTGLPVTTNPTDNQVETAAWQSYQSTPKLQAYISGTYGYVGAWMLSNPTVAKILVAAGRNGWQQGRFDAAIEQTTWWKQTSQAQRNAQQLQVTDPGSWSQQMLQMQDIVLNYAQSIGISLSATSLKKLATTAITFNWTSTTIQQVMRQTSSQATATPQVGQSATFADQARELAGEYAINLTTATLGKYVQQNQSGTLTAAGLQSIFAQQASNAYPWMKQAIQQGVTPTQFLSNYASAAGSTLEVDPTSIRWTTPKWTKALLTNADGSTSSTAPVNIGVFQQNLMKTASYGYSKTQGARDAAYGMASSILQEFGKVA